MKYISLWDHKQPWVLFCGLLLHTVVLFLSQVGCFLIMSSSVIDGLSWHVNLKGFRSFPSFPVWIPLQTYEQKPQTLQFNYAHLKTSAKIIWQIYHMLLGLQIYLKQHQMAKKKNQNIFLSHAVIHCQRTLCCSCTEVESD